MKNEIDAFPINYAPNADSVFSEPETNYILRRYYIIALWLAIPILSLSRYKMGERFFSTKNIVCSWILISTISFLIYSSTFDFYIPFSGFNIPINFIFYALIFASIVFARKIIAMLIIIFIAVFLSFFSSIESDAYLGVLFIVGIIFMIFFAGNHTNRIIRYFNKGYLPSRNSYFYGYNFIHSIKSIEPEKSGDSYWQKHTITSIIESVAFMAIMIFISGRDKENYAESYIPLFLIIAISNIILAFMQGWAVQQYQDDLSDSQAPLSDRKMTGDDALTPHPVKSVR